ncbi:hypothetical protein BamIOP4010DRAFT_1318 [Burkholderia ambifaria IOP40-10]|uniref:Uncharacterized protein n=1 Tax=Burkholderia ambifaria IOP40-10 TaxID=396596 RepID=B1FBA9_9BURK|nr:hypothetical protein [Burkholderia ambifaria]EDT05191.1 hypothetical protein BamIOP4010DRAFT_1318 [Burkholderia ambifaria IOP40-10]
MNVAGAQKVQGPSVARPSTSIALSTFADEGLASVLEQVTHGMETMLEHSGQCFLNVNQPAKIFHMIVDVCQDVSNEERARLADMHAMRDKISRDSMTDGSGAVGVGRPPVDEASEFVVQATVHASEDDSSLEVRDRPRTEMRLPSEIQDRVRKHPYVRQLARCLGMEVLGKVNKAIYEEEDTRL